MNEYMKAKAARLMTMPAEQAINTRTLFLITYVGRALVTVRFEWD